LLTGGQIADCTAGAVLLEEMPRSAILHGDKGYDSDAIRRQVEGKGAMPNIPPKANDAGRIASRPSSIEAATPSSACSVA
jgi:IS5 family transposase